MLPNAPGNFDGFGQAYPIYSKIDHEFESFLSGSGMQRWSWDVGLGASFFDTFRSRLLNPLTYIMAAFPGKYLDIVYSVFAVIRQYFTGVAFLLFTRELKYSNAHRVIGAFCYSFSGWIVCSTVEQADFNNAAIIFPLLVLGAEKILKNKTPLVFVLSIILCMTTSKLWVYISAISVILFFIIRYSYYHNEKSVLRTYINKNFLLAFLRFCGYGIIGILMSSLFFISILYSTAGEVTNTNVEKFGLIYPIKYYLTLPQTFFNITQSHTPYSLMFAPVLIISMLPLVARNAFRERNTASIIFLILFAASLFPITGKIFNGFSYVVSRWYYVLAFFMCWAAMDACNEKALRKKSNYFVCMIWLLLLGAYNIGICYYYLDLIPRVGMFATIIGVSFGILILTLLFSKEHLSKWPSMVAGCLAILLLIGSTIGAGNMKFYPGVNPTLFRYEKVGSMYDKFNSLSSQHIIPDIQKQDTSFFRTDQVDTNNDYRQARVLSNMNIYSGNRSIYQYFSSTDSAWFAFNKLMGNNAGYFDRTCVYSNDNRAALDYLMGVKYFIGDSKIKKPGANDYAPYGYSYYKTIDEIQVLKNKYCMGLGTTFDKYITETELNKFAPLEREQVLMQALVVKDKTNKSELSGVRHADLSELKTDIDYIDCTPFSEGKDIKLGNHTIEVFAGDDKNESAFYIELPDIYNAQVILSFENLKRKKCDYITKSYYNKSEPKDSFLIQNSYIDNERFNIFVAKERVKKDALNEKGKNQGFSDVKDFNINLGYYDRITGKVRIRITNAAKYTYDSIRAYIIPMDIYDENAKILDARKYKIDTFENEYISGNISCKKDSLLYLSILDDPGWHIKIDGKERNKLNDVNAAFTGVRVTKGDHTVELVYKYPGLKTGIAMTLLGTLVLIFALLYRRRHINERSIFDNTL